MTSLGKSKTYVLTVLCPNGRRINVKSDSSMCIAQVIEETCKKFNYDPLDYNVKHLKRIVDAASTVGYSNLPNHGQLELVPAEPRRKEGKVQVNLVTGENHRFVDDFSSDVSLWDVLVHHEKSNTVGWSLPEIEDAGAGKPFVVYAMRRFDREQMTKVTLKSLGLFAGKCLIRYNVDKEGQSTSISDTLPSTMRDSVTLKTPSRVEAVENPNFDNKKFIIESNICSNEPSISENVPNYSPDQSNNAKMTSKQDQELMDSSNNLKEDLDYSTNLETPSESNTNVQNDFKVSGCISGNISTNSSNTHEKETLDCVMQVASGSGFGIASSIVCHNETTNENKNDLPCPIVKDEEPKIIPLAGHDSILFSLDDAPHSSLEHCDDSDFELTVNEVRSLYAEQVRKIKEIDDCPMQTQQMRQLENDTRLLAAMNRYPVTQIRVCFPDRLVVQANFKPQSKIDDVMQFLRPLLTDPAKNFYLYINFPRTVLNPEMTLSEAGCIPKALLYFGSDAYEEHFLSAEAMLKKSTFTGAVRKLIQNRGKKSEVPSSKNQEPPMRKSTPSATSRETSKKTVPKWFKLGK